MRSLRIGYALLVPTALTLLIAVSGCAQPAGDPPQAPPPTVVDRPAVEEMILGWNDAWIDAIVTKDVVVLDDILAADFVYTIGSGEVREKAAFVDGIRTDAGSITSMALSDLAFRWFSDDVVLVTARESWQGADAQGTQAGGTEAMTNVWMRRDGVWQCVAGHITPVMP